MLALILYLDDKKENASALTKIYYKCTCTFLIYLDSLKLPQESLAKKGMMQ